MSNSSPAPSKLIAVVAMASNRVIGRDGKLPWHFPEDLKFFKRTTLGHPVLMGRKTFDSIVAQLGKPLPNRTNVVLSRSMKPMEGVNVVKNFEELNEFLQKNATVYLIGGAELYALLLEKCDELILTYISKPYEGDAFFPAFENQFELKETLGGGEGFEFRRYVSKA